MIFNQKFYEQLAQTKGDMALHYQKYAPARRLEETVRLVEGKNYACVLDIGCGDGVLLNHVEMALNPNRSHSTSFTAVDLSITRLTRTKQRTGASGCVSDIMYTPFPGNLFDLVLCTEVLEHLPMPKTAIAELARVTRKKGTVIVSVPIANWYRTFLAKLGREIPYLDKDEHLREYSYLSINKFERISSLLEDMRKVGLIPVKKKGAYFWQGEEKLRLNRAYEQRNPVIQLLSLIDHFIGLIPIINFFGRYLILELRKE